MRKLNYMLPPRLDPDDPRLFQEQLKTQCVWDDDLMWAMACCCTIQSKTSRPVAFPVMNRFLQLFTPDMCRDAVECVPLYHDLLDTLRPGGLYHVKATRLISLSHDWLDGHSYDKLSGSSTYFQQSYDIFVRDRFPHIDRIVDTHLRSYVCDRERGSSFSRQ